MDCLTGGLASKGGNVAILFAVSVLSGALLVAGAMDLTLALSSKSHIQGAADAAVLAAVRETSRLIEAGEPAASAAAAGRQVGAQVFNADTARLSQAVVGRFQPTVVVQADTVKGTGRFSGSARSWFASAFGHAGTDLVIDAHVEVSRPQFVDIHFVIDTSASMGVGAETSDITLMANAIGCAFACHAPAGNTYFSSTVAPARATGARLRIDVVKAAVDETLKSLEDRRLGDRLRVAVHTFSNRSTTLVSLTSDIAAARTSLGGLELNDDWLEGGTNFNAAFEEIASRIGRSGNGRSATARKHYVILLTDGVSTDVRFNKTSTGEWEPDPDYEIAPPTINGAGFFSSQALDDRTCRPLKAGGAMFFALNIEYVIPHVGTDDDPRFSEIEATLAPLIDDRMRGCASDREHAFKVRSGDDLRAALSEVSDTIAESSLRLTH